MGVELRSALASAMLLLADQVRALGLHSRLQDVTLPSYGAVHWECRAEGFPFPVSSSHFACKFSARVRNIR